MAEPQHDPGEQPVAPTWHVDAAVAAALFVLGIVVIIDSLRLGVGWADDGPQSGYFPFYIGILLCAASAWNLVRAIRGNRAGSFLSQRSLRNVLAVFVPSAVYVGAMYVLGLYVASAIFIAGFMRWHGGFGWLGTVAVALGVPLALFLMFERWFLVPLPKGPLERLIGL